MSTPSDGFAQGDEQAPQDNEQAPQDREPEPVSGEQKIEGQSAEEQETIYPASTLPQLPPEAAGEVNGGPLGCCLGVMAGLLLGALLALGLPLLIASGGYFRTITALAILIGAIVGGFAGWKLGKKFYREYEQPIIKVKKRSR
ncbi:MAG: hypothetical protein J2P37_02495 [Ktedonobacteraceae bacterium]|nr:hypothetical protein [Ktedonobacteraceae bacterium]MBO0791451.1 hypothetical protein [Ktedonobacteraceae bacterium]